MTTEFHKLVMPFLDEIRNGRVEIYNEFSLQHELGIFLRHVFSSKKVQFERNVRFFFPTSPPELFSKREIDISVFSSDKSQLDWAIELKYPRNGQHPEQMFSFCIDITFTEQLKKAGFRGAGVLIFADDRNFWSGGTDGIYGFFRAGGRPLNGLVMKPTGAKDAEVKICGTYTVEWETITDHLRCVIIEAQPFLLTSDTERRALVEFDG